MKPYEEKGYSERGAFMGRRSDNPANFEGRKTHLRCVPMTDYGNYDIGGAYWGSGTPVYCAWSDAVWNEELNCQEEKIVYYFRAATREIARKEMLQYGAKLYR